MMLGWQILKAALTLIEQKPAKGNTCFRDMHYSIGLKDMH